MFIDDEARVRVDCTKGERPWRMLWNKRNFLVLRHGFLVPDDMITLTESERQVLDSEKPKNGDEAWQLLFLKGLQESLILLLKQEDAPECFVPESISTETKEADCPHDCKIRHNGRSIDARIIVTKQCCELPPSLQVDKVRETHGVHDFWFAPTTPDKGAYLKLSRIERNDEGHILLNLDNGDLICFEPLDTAVPTPWPYEITALFSGYIRTDTFPAACWLELVFPPNVEHAQDDTMILGKRFSKISDEASFGEMLSVPEAASYANVSVRTIQRWIKDDLLQGVKGSGSLLRIPKSSLATYAKRPNA